MARGRGWCVAKSALFVASLRSLGIPARPAYADVKNHLATPRLLEALGSDIFYWHSYSEVLIEERWVKATPVFNESLCDKFGLKALDFDGPPIDLINAEGPFEYVIQTWL